MSSFKEELTENKSGATEYLTGGTKPKDDLLDVLKLKLQGKSPEDIAGLLDMRLVDVYKHDRKIRARMKSEKLTELSNMDSVQLEAMADTLKTLMPYMEKSTRAIARTAKSVKPLYGDMVENAELLHSLIHKALLIELEKDEVDVKKVAQLNGILNDSYKAFFNKEGIQIVNVLNDNSVNTQETRFNMLKDLADSADSDNVIDVETGE